MAQKFTPYTFRPGEVIEPTRVNENARAFANEFNGNLDRENLREDSITSDKIVDQSCNLVGNRMMVARSVQEIFGSTLTSQTRQMSFRTMMSEDFQIKHDALLICSYSFRFSWKDSDNSSGSYSTSNGGSVALSNTDRHSATFTLRINGIEVSRSAVHSYLRKDDSVFLSGAHPVSAGTVTIDCQIKIVDETTDHEFFIHNFNGIARTGFDDILNFKFKKR